MYYCSVENECNNPYSNICVPIKFPRRTRDKMAVVLFSEFANSPARNGGRRMAGTAYDEGRINSPSVTARGSRRRQADDISAVSGGRRRRYQLLLLFCGSFSPIASPAHQVLRNASRRAHCTDSVQRAECAVLSRARSPGNGLHEHSIVVTSTPSCQRGCKRTVVLLYKLLA